MAKVESRQGSEERGHPRHRGDERGRAPTQSARAVGARDRKDREETGEERRERDTGEWGELHREGDADGAARRGKERRPENRGHRVVTMSFMSAKTRAVTRPRV